MNKRPLPSSGGPGLPAKPYNPGAQPGPAPPLPPGPPPPQAPGYPPAQQDPQAAAHAAAWAAYYQSQGISAGAYGAAPQPQHQQQQQQQQPAQAGGANPYANYGYGAGAQHTAYQPVQPSQPQAAYGQQAYPPAQPQPQPQPQAGPSHSPYRPAGGNTPGYGGNTPGYGGYTAPTQQGYGAAPQAFQPAPSIGPQRPPYQSPAPAAPQWQAPQQQQQQHQQQQRLNQPYRPPQQGFNQPFQQQQQPSFSPGPQQTPFRPSPAPTPPRPFNAPPQRPPPRPPVQAAQGGFPPAKRPRFDGPGQGQGQLQPGAMGGVAMQGIPARPIPSGPSGAAVRPFGPRAGTGPMGINNGQPGFIPVRPLAGGVGGIGGGIGVGRAAVIPPVQRPPIHLGMGGPPPGIIASRGGLAGRGGLAARGGRGGGVINAPRGPSGVSGMRRDVRGSSARPGMVGSAGVKTDLDKERREREKKRKESEREREMKTTMTDFRIVGIEVKELGWSWGVVGEEARKLNEQVEEAKAKEEEEKEKEKEKELEEEKEEPKEKEEAKEVEGVKSEEGIEAKKENGHKSDNGAVEGQPAKGEVVKEEEFNGDAVEAEKRGEKRKANSPDIGEEDEIAAKKRAAVHHTGEEEGEASSLSLNKQSATLPSTEATEITAVTELQLPELVPGTEVKEETLDKKEPSAPAAPAENKFENNQNRFRIYFESPPELDRIPKAARRGNKRWRRESSSVDVGRLGEEAEQEELPEEDATAERTIQEGAEGAETAETPLPKSEARVAEAVEELAGGVEPVAHADVQQEVSAAPDELAVPASSSEDALVHAEQLAETQPTVTAGDIPSAANESAAAESTQVDVVATIVTEDLAGDDHPEHDGDISMMTDPSAIPAMLSELDQTEATIGSAPTAPGEAVAEVIEDVTEAAPIQTDALTTESNAEAEANGAGQVSTEAANGIATPATPLDVDVEGKATPENAEELEQSLVRSAAATTAAYKSRARRRSSVSSTDSRDYDASVVGEQSRDKDASAKGDTPSTNRISVLYEESTRRICLDAKVVKKVRIYRKQGRIEVVLAPESLIPQPQTVEEVKQDGAEQEEKKDNVDLPKGVLIEMYDPVDQRFVATSKEKLEELWSAASDEASTVPPLHRAFSSGAGGAAIEVQTSGAQPEVVPEQPTAQPADQTLTLTVYLNKKRPLSEPKWCRADSADEWLYETFGSRKGFNEAGWRGKLEVVDPDPSPTLQSILDSWASSSSSGDPSDRRSFVTSLLSDPIDLLEILLRLTRGDRNPTTGSASTSTTSGSQGFGSLASAIRHDSPYASHQTHVSLAILAMYRLTTDYAAKAGESEGVKEKVSDIVRSLPVGMINRSLDGLFREWEGR